MKKKAKPPIDMKAALREAILVSPKEVFTVAQAKEAFMNTFLHDDAVKDVLQSLSGGKDVLEAEKRGRFAVVDENRGGNGSLLKDAIVASVCIDSKGPIDIDTLKALVLTRTGISYDPFTIRSNALDLTDKIAVTTTTYDCIGRS